MSRKTKHAVSHVLPEKTSKLSVEIFRLLREGDTNSRNKAQELLQTAIEKRHAEKRCAQVKGDAS
ncbi:hypothetical protein HMI48_05215 [Acidithiobacillus ferrooxidans]|uniref:hypothetical protein n=1 Tax=Acidithiobacillus ferrooxidans TaxID=920 RepID=UPI001C0677AF|nr:hypothetical protein [Acidithiobacillus ferrooxidans]MBU2773325.1 hypothetical protein [Acidithiobacillus ferrooxidans]